MKNYGFMLRKKNDNQCKLDENHRLITIRAKSEQNAFHRLIKNCWELIEKNNFIEVLGEEEKK
jgi:hypothetical protein